MNSGRILNIRQWSYDYFRRESKRNTAYIRIKVFAYLMCRIRPSSSGNLFRTLCIIQCSMTFLTWKKKICHYRISQLDAKLAAKISRSNFPIHQNVDFLQHNIIFDFRRSFVLGFHISR